MICFSLFQIVKILLNFIASNVSGICKAILEKVAVNFRDLLSSKLFQNDLQAIPSKKMKRLFDFT